MLFKEKYTHITLNSEYDRPWPVDGLWRLRSIAKMFTKDQICVKPLNRLSFSCQPVVSRPSEAEALTSETFASVEQKSHSALQVFAFWVIAVDDFDICISNVTSFNHPLEGRSSGSAHGWVLTFVGSILSQRFPLFIMREKRDPKTQWLKEPNRWQAGSSPVKLTDSRRLRRVLRKWADGSAKFPRYTSIHPLWHPFFFKHLGSVSQKQFFFFNHVAHLSNDKIAQRLSPKRAGVPPARHCKVCPRSSRTETVETDSFLTHTHTKGKNESMSRGETWSNCSLPLSSWFPA